MIGDQTADRDELVALATVKTVFHAGPVTPGFLLAYAITYAANGWPVFPLSGKVPAIRNPHPRGSVARKDCKGECGQHGHGLYDATTDLEAVSRWWTVDYVGANIGIRPLKGMFVLDNDPKTPGHVEALEKLIAEHGPLPRTLTSLSGRLDGGRHRFYRRPSGKLSTARLGVGFDIKDHGGYVVAPPSIHPDTGWPYIEEVRAEIADPGWLTDLIVVPEPRRREQTASEMFFAASRRTVRSGQSPADAYTDSSTWREVLEPHGWTCLDPDADADGARWLHPVATSQCSATVRNDCLFVYSTNTPFEPTTAGEAHGYTKFRAYAVLNFGGDMKSAARSLMQGAA